MTTAVKLRQRPVRDELEIHIATRDRQGKRLEGKQLLGQKILLPAFPREDLTDENDLLETALEVVAQPPGKKLQNVTLLSGGEKALTAVAMIFSIFQIKPSPFCLLDEVDAPLDDANIGRFNDIVATMAKTSQFIIITHNKRTMEIADNLYGITMEEPGVSKLVSVCMKEVA